MGKKAKPREVKRADHKPATRTLYVFYWQDIEADAAWGTSSTGCPVCVSVGYVYARPSVRQGAVADRYWHIVRDWVEGEPGGEIKIPASVMREVVEFGEVGMVYREARS